MTTSRRKAKRLSEEHEKLRDAVVEAARAGQNGAIADIDDLWRAANALRGAVRALEKFERENGR